MKNFIRPVALLCAASMLVSCASPYQAQMGALNQAYSNGQISRAEYDREMTRLQVNDAGYQQQNANTATAVAVGAAAIGAAAIIANNNDNHHNHYYSRRPYHHHHGGRW